MAYRQVWWHDNVEYGAGCQTHKTWPNVLEQYRHPEPQRYYDPPIPTETYSDNFLYYERPQLGKPEYRGKFRDKPFPLPKYYPEGIETKPIGYHGRVYYEHGPPKFKYNGPAKNELHWLEHPDLLPRLPRARSENHSLDSSRGLNNIAVSAVTFPTTSPAAMRSHVLTESTRLGPGYGRSHRPVVKDRSNIGQGSHASTHPARLTQDGVGFL